jgi:integrase
MFDIKVDTKMTFNELTKWYLGLEKVKDMASYDTICISLKKFNMVFGSRIVSKVRPADLENYQAMRQRAGMADATIDHEIGKTKTMIFKAFDNGMVSPDTLRTFRKVKKLLVKDSDVRHRIISPDEFKALMKHSKGHIKDIIAMGYYTGMRRGEILGLTWDKVDFSMRMIRLESTDLKTARLGMFQFAPSYLGYCKKCQTDFMQTARTIMYSSIKGGPVKDIRAALRIVCKLAGIVYGRFKKDGFIFHDLRHTFNTNMRKAGVQESVIMEITGHTSREMFDRYNNIDEEDTHNAMDRLEGYFSGGRKIFDQIVDQEGILKKKTV